MKFLSKINKKIVQNINKNYQTEANKYGFVGKNVNLKARYYSQKNYRLHIKKIKRNRF